MIGFCPASIARGGFRGNFRVLLSDSDSVGGATPHTPIPTSAVRRINNFVCNGSTPESSLHLGHFQRVGEVQIQVLQQDRLMLGGSTDATLSDRHSVSRR